MFLVPYDTPGFRIGKVFNKSGWRFYRNGEMIFENARVPHTNVVGQVNTSDMKTAAAGDRTGGDLFGDLELAANALGRLRRRLRAGDEARPHRQAGRPGAVRAAERAAQDQQDEHADRGAALDGDAGRLGARSQGAFGQRRPRHELLDRRDPGGHRAEPGDSRRRRRQGRAPRREARARRLHLEPSRRRHRAAAQGRRAARAAWRRISTDSARHSANHPRHSAGLSRNPYPGLD